MFKKLALIAVAAVISSAAIVSTAAPADAQGISVRLGDGHRDGYRGGGYRRHSDFGRRDRGYHRGWGRRPRGRTIIVR